MEKKFTSKRALCTVFGNAMNLLVPDAEDHHQRIAYLSYKMAEYIGLSEGDREKTAYAALLHDIGIVVMPERTADSEKGPYTFKELCVTGKSIIGDIPGLDYVREIFDAEASDYVNLMAKAELTKYETMAQIIDLSDKVVTALDSKIAALNQKEDICDTISDFAGEELKTEIIEAFLNLSNKEYIWFETLHRPDVYLEMIPELKDVSLDEMIGYAKFMARIIDYRSRYTTMHSTGVAATAVRLAEIMGMSEEECKKMLIAGYIHDIGKLKVPKSILDKTEKLTDEEFNIVKEYAYYTFLLLNDVEGLEQIGKWAALHHERLNGYGYPFGLKADDIPMGARILAIADIFSAVGEIRSYRSGMSRDEIMMILKSNVESGAVSRSIAEIMLTNYDNIYEVRENQAKAEGARYYAAVLDVDED